MVKYLTTADPVLSSVLKLMGYKMDRVELDHDVCFYSFDSVKAEDIKKFEDNRIKVDPVIFAGIYASLIALADKLLKE